MFYVMYPNVSHEQLSQGWKCLNQQKRPSLGERLKTDLRRAKEKIQVLCTATVNPDEEAEDKELKDLHALIGMQCRTPTLSAVSYPV
jgi:hypothetical protein